MMAYSSNGGTHTRRGFVPYLQMRTGAGQSFEAPVKLLVRVSDGGSETHKVRRDEPLVRHGQYVYALPGGGEILGGRVRGRPLVTAEELGLDGPEEREQNG